MKKQSIKKLIGNKPSVAIQAMIDGLKHQSRRKLFKIDMSTYGKVRKNGKLICYGCAATSTIQHLADKDFVPKSNQHDLFAINEVDTRCNYLGFDDVDELNRFERCIDLFRTGEIDSLHRFIFGNDVTCDFYRRVYHQPFVPKQIRKMLIAKYNFDINRAGYLPIPTLNNETWKEDLHHYQELADNYRAIGY